MLGRLLRRSRARDAAADPKVATVRDQLLSSVVGSTLGLAQRGGAVPIQPNFVNSGTGAGTHADHNWQSAFVEPWLAQVQLEVIYRTSWAAAKLIDIPVDDMFVAGREWTGDDEAAIEAMEDTERQLDAHNAVAGAMKAGRLYGSALLCIMSTGVEPTEPLDPETVQEGSLANLLVVDRWNASIELWHTDPTQPLYSKPFMYQVTPRVTQGERPTLFVHHSRVIRFDGHKSLLTEGWNYGDRDWGVSELNMAINAIARNEHGHVAIGHLLQESSMLLMRISGLKDAIKGRVGADEPTISELGTAVNALKSTFRTVFTDIEDEVSRVAVSFAGLADILDRDAELLAAIADIPMTRYWSRSPAGMNATGQSDMQNYAIRVASLQDRLLASPLRMLDTCLARHAGIRGDVPEYEWRPLLSLTPEQQAKTTELRVKSIAAALTAGIIDEDEARERLSGDPTFGELPPITEEQRRAMMEMRMAPFADPDAEADAEEGDEGDDSEPEPDDEED